MDASFMPPLLRMCPHASYTDVCLAYTARVSRVSTLCLHSSTFVLEREGRNGLCDLLALACSVRTQDLGFVLMPRYGRILPRPLAEIVQILLQQHQQQRSAHNCPNDPPAAPQLLAATESLRDRWRNDAATLECLRELTKLDLSACEISSFEDCSIDQCEERWASNKLSILLDSMPQLTSLDLRNSPRIKQEKYHEKKYRDEN